MASPNITEIATTAIEARTGKLADNVSNNTMLLSRLKSKGKIKNFDGGRTILQEMQYAENESFKWYAGYEVIDIRPSDVFTSAEYPIRQASVVVSMSGLEEIQNSGDAQMIDLLASRIDNAQKTMTNGLSKGLYSDGTDANGKQIDGLQAAIVAAPTTGTYGGINRANWSFWRNQTESGVTSANIRAKMRALWTKCVRNDDMPDLIAMDDIFYNAYWAGLADLQRFTAENAEKAIGGWPVLKFNTADVVLDGGLRGNAPDNSGFFLNCDFAHWRPHARRNMTIARKRFAVNQDASVIPIFFAGNFTLSNASLQGRLSA